MEEGFIPISAELSWVLKNFLASSRKLTLKRGSCQWTCPRTKGGKHIQCLQSNNKKREQTHPVCLHPEEMYEQVKSVNTQKIMKQQVKNEQMKRKQTCSLCFVNVFKFQENKFKIVQNNLLEIKVILIK